MRQDLIGALQSALVRGETLKKAMMALHNAGYKKQEIEEAAASLQQLTQQSKIKETIPQTNQPQTTSDIPDHEKPSSKIKIILIISIIIILIGILISTFLFKAELIELLNNIFN